MSDLQPKQFKTLYRGVNVATHPQNELGHDIEGNPSGHITSLPNPLKTSAGVTSNTGIGIHWTDRRNIAKVFGPNQGNPYKVALDMKRPHSAIITAQVPHSSLAENNPYFDPSSHNIFDYDDPSIQEKEVPVSPGATVKVTKIEKFRGNNNKKREIRFNPPREVKA